MNTKVTIKENEQTVPPIRGRDVVDGKLYGIYRPECVSDGSLFVYWNDMFLVVPTGKFSYMPTTVWTVGDFLNSYKNEPCLKINKSVNIEFTN